MSDSPDTYTTGYQWASYTAEKIDAYCCPDCGFLFAGYDRSPPRPHCPHCGCEFIHQLREGELATAEMGLVPARIA